MALFGSPSSGPMGGPAFGPQGLGVSGAVPNRRGKGQGGVSGAVPNRRGNPCACLVLWELCIPLLGGWEGSPKP